MHSRHLSRGRRIDFALTLSNARTILITAGALVDGLTSSAPAELKELVTAGIEQAMAAVLARVVGPTVVGPATNGQPSSPGDSDPPSQPDSQVSAQPSG